MILSSLQDKHKWFRCQANHRPGKLRRCQTCKGTFILQIDEFKTFVVFVLNCFPIERVVVLLIHLILMRCGSGSWILTGKYWILIQDMSVSVRFTKNFLTKQNYQIILSPFFVHLNARTWTIQRSGNLFSSSDLWFESKQVFFCTFWLIFCPLDSYIFPDPYLSTTADEWKGMIRRRVVVTFTLWR